MINRIRVSFWHRLIAYTLTIILSSTLLFTLPVQADSGSNTQCILWIFCSQDDRGRGNASRGPCAGLEKGNLTALLPVNRSKPVDTIATAPTFWFYLPYTSKRAKFMLLDSDKHPVLQQPIYFNLESVKPGIAQFTLAANEPMWLPGKSFEVGKPYNWYFSVICDAQKPSRNPVASGWVRRTVLPPDLEQKRLTIPAQEHYQFFVQNQIWSDALTELVKDHTVAPEDWQKLLKFLELDAVAPEQINQINQLQAIAAPSQL